MIDIKAFSLAGTTGTRGTYAIVGAVTAPAVVQVPSPQQYAVSRINYRFYNDCATPIAVFVTYDGSQPAAVFPVSGVPQACMVLGPKATEVFEGGLNAYITVIAPLASTPAGSVYVSSEQGT